MRVEGKACADGTGGLSHTHTHTHTRRHLSRKPTATAFFACTVAQQPNRRAHSHRKKSTHHELTYDTSLRGQVQGREGEAVGGEKGGAERCVPHQCSWAASRARTRGGELCKGCNSCDVVTVAGEPTVAYAVRQVMSTVSTSRLEGSLMV